VRLIFFLFVALLTIIAAKADIVSSTLTGSTGNGGFDVCGSAPAPNTSPPVPCSQALAESFTPSGDFILTDAKLIVGNQAGTSPLFNVWLAQDSGGSPGSFIEQIGFDVLYSGEGASGEVMADSIATPILLTSGTKYWLVLTPAQSDTIVYWDAGSPPFPCSSCVAVTHTTDGTGGWTTYAYTYTGQMQIDGTASVPEPSAFILLLTTLPAVILLGRKRLAQRDRTIR
jgi:hypothetical protein